MHDPQVGDLYRHRRSGKEYELVKIGVLFVFIPTGHRGRVLYQTLEYIRRYLVKEVK